MQTKLFDDNKPKGVSRKRNGVKRGSWDAKYYKQIYNWVRENLRYSPIWYLKGEKPCPIDHVKTYFPLISSCVYREDYESAQAVKDAIIDFLNELGAEIPDSAELKIPDYKPIKTKGLICYGKNDDRIGLDSGSAEFITDE